MIEKSNWVKEHFLFTYEKLRYVWQKRDEIHGNLYIHVHTEMIGTWRLMNAGIICKPTFLNLKLLNKMKPLAWIEMRPHL